MEMTRGHCFSAEWATLKSNLGGSIPSGAAEGNRPFRIRPARPIASPCRHSQPGDVALFGLLPVPSGGMRPLRWLMAGGRSGIGDRSMEGCLTAWTLSILIGRGT